MKRYVTFYDTTKNTFILAKREIYTSKYEGFFGIKEGLIRNEQIFNTRDEAIKSLKNSNYEEV